MLHVYIIFIYIFVFNDYWNSHMLIAGSWLTASRLTSIFENIRHLWSLFNYQNKSRQSYRHEAVLDSNKWEHWDSLVQQVHQFFFSFKKIKIKLLFTFLYFVAPLQLLFYYRNAIYSICKMLVVDCFWKHLVLPLFNPRAILRPFHGRYWELGSHVNEPWATAST